METPQVLMQVDQLTKTFSVKQGFFQKIQFNAVDQATFTIERGKVYGLVGESGCGKSTLSSNMLLLDEPTSGTITYDGETINPKNKKHVQKMRREIQLIFQDPYASIDPKMKIKDIVIEPMWRHKIYPTKERCYEKAKSLLAECGLSEEAMERYPNEFSGGQRQRVSIARVLGMRPKLIVADESTAALDVSVQAQILNLLKDLQQNYNLTMVFVSHNLSVIKHISDVIIVMYMGVIVEIGKKEEIYRAPKHPYTKLLFSAVPNPDPLNKSAYVAGVDELPSHMNMPSGCPFRTRCDQCMDICAQEKPSYLKLGEDSFIRCHLYNDAVPEDSERSCQS